MLIVVACAVPYATVIFGTSHSIFGRGSGEWFVVEPAGVAIFALVGGVLLCLPRAVRSRGLAVAGALAAFGVQTMLLFAGYQFGLAGTGTRSGSAGIIGMLAGLLLLAAGVLAAGSTAGRRGGARHPAPTARPPEPRRRRRRGRKPETPAAPDQRAPAAAAEPDAAKLAESGPAAEPGPAAESGPAVEPGPRTDTPDSAPG